MFSQLRCSSHTHTKVVAVVVLHTAIRAVVVHQNTLPRSVTRHRYHLVSGSGLRPRTSCPSHSTNRQVDGTTVRSDCCHAPNTPTSPMLSQPHHLLQDEICLSLFTANQLCATPPELARPTQSNAFSTTLPPPFHTSSNSAMRVHTPARKSPLPADRRTCLRQIHTTAQAPRKAAASCTSSLRMPSQHQQLRLS